MYIIIINERIFIIFPECWRISPRSFSALSFLYFTRSFQSPLSLSQLFVIMKNLFSPFFTQITTEPSMSDSFSLQNLSGVHLGIVLAKTKKICFIAENVFVFELSSCICNLVFCVVIHCFGWLGLAQRAWCQNCFQVPTTLDSREEETWFVNIRPFDKFKCTFIICDHLDSTGNIFLMMSTPTYMSCVYPLYVQ